MRAERGYVGGAYRREGGVRYSTALEPVIMIHELWAEPSHSLINKPTCRQTNPLFLLQSDSFRKSDAGIIKKKKSKNINISVQTKIRL